ncbi:zinc ribbon domain-containing protein [Aquibacillus saliphilus]|uniref:zinc ribbon domain-containing protein n=1 Tax=Aquibacillus saliphilus TaxID=1909422 RepID=UPI001CEFF1BB|nr:zinc ribbon domain-containing protein [Aquibacillus saliphilus]
MNCNQCGSTNNKSAKFCGECGTELVSIESKTDDNQVDSSDQKSGKPAEGLSFESESIEDGNTVAERFLNFVAESVKGPMRASRKVTKDNLISVLITHVLFAITLSLFIYFMSNSFGDTFLGLAQIPFIFVVVTLFFFILIYLAVYTGIVFGIAKIMQVDTSYTQVMVRLGVFIVIPVVLLVLAIIFYLISATTFSFILFGFAVFLFFVSSFLTIFSVMEDSTVGLDFYYGLILTIIAISIILFILGDSVLGNLFDQILVELM